MPEPDWKFYFEELMSDECACGRPKKPKFSFCYTCYRKLPHDMKRALYRRLHEGYEAAYDAAYAYLNESGGYDGDAGI